MRLNVFGDDYTPGEITEAIYNWVYVWEEIAGTLSYNPYRLSFTSPHVLLLDMVEELNFNKMQFQNNWNHFRIQSNEIIGSDPVIEKFFASEFSLLAKQLHNPKFPDYILTLCKNILEIFDNGIYFQKNLELLKGILLDSTFSERNKNAILILSQNLILELFLNGYELESIAEMPFHIFSKYEEFKLNSDKSTPDNGEPENTSRDSIITTNFPVAVKPDAFNIKGKFDQTAYDKAKKAEIDSLTIENRIDALKRYFNKEKEEGIFIFEIEGMKDNFDLTIGNVNFYSPQLKQYSFREKEITEQSGNPELFNKKSDDRFINAAIPISYRDISYGMNQAINQIDKTLNILRLYVHSDTPFKILHNSFLVVKNGRVHILKSGLSKDDPAYKKLFSVNLKKYPKILNNPFLVKNLNRLFFNDPVKNNLNTKNISLSLFWFRKGSESTKNEDKLLYHWISIENLFNFSSEMIVSKKDDNLKNISIIKELVPSLIILHEISQNSINLLSLLWSDYSFNHVFPSHPLSKITPNTLEMCQLNLMPGDPINPKKFITSLPMLRKEIPDYIYTNKIDYTYNLYKDKNFAKKQIDIMESQILSEIDRIYRYRNFIVHNANSDSQILPFFTNKTEKFAIILIASILNGMIDVNDKNSFDVIFDKKSQLDQILVKLNSADNIDLSALLYD
jgi:hypothetical protein